MPASRSSGAAAAARTATVALVLAAAVVGAGYGVQKVLLRAPTHGELVAARIEGAVIRYRYVTSVVHVEGEPVRRAQCLEGWEPGRNGRPAGRGARVAFSDGERLILGDRRVKRIAAAARPTRLRPLAEIQLAGCARSLTNHIYDRLVGGRRTHAVRARFAGRPVLRLHVRTRRSDFDLLVDPVSLAPVGVRVLSDGVSGWSTLEPRRLRPGVKRAFLERFDG